MLRTRKLEKQSMEKAEGYRIQKELRIAQLKAIKAQMNPHFIFNVLNSIQALYLIEDQEAANEQLHNFAHLIRMTLEYSDEYEIPLLEEINITKHYLEVEKGRFIDDFNYTIDISPNVNLSSVKVPALFLQPYVENAIKHGLMHRSDKKELSLSVKQTNNCILVKIDDNGIGRDAANEIKKKRKGYSSFAISANQQRLDLINTDRRNKLSIEFVDKFDKK